MKPNSIEILSLLVEGLNSGDVKVIDLTQPLGPQTPVIGLPPPFASSPGFSREVISRYDDKGPDWYWNTLHFGEHTGTHFDAPNHWITGRDIPDNALDTIPARRFIGPACVIDCSHEAAASEDFLLTRECVLAWEAQHGRIPPGAWLLMRTDWSKRVGTDRFLNVREDGEHSPGFHPDCSRLLALERAVLGVGVECVGTDSGQAHRFDPPFPNHTIMHGAGKFGLASLCNLDLLPPVGAVIIAGPLKVVDGSGSPVRVIALTPDNQTTDQR
jgi:isatin hydrolase